MENSLRNINYNLAKDILHGESPHPLQYSVLFRIAIKLLQQSNLQRKICATFNPPSGCVNLTDQFVDHVRDPKMMVLNLSLPTCFQVELVEIMCELESEIFTFLMLLGQLQVPFNTIAVEDYLSNLCFTFNGTVNVMNTITAIIENSNLSNLEKYKLACSYCLKEKIIDLYSELDEFFHLNFYNDISFRLTLFWTFEIKSYHAEFQDIISKELGFISHGNVYILEWAIKHGNEVAVHYIWENFNNSEMKIRIMHFIGLAYKYKNMSINVFLYLITQMDSAEFEILCLIIGYEILNMISEDRRWNKYFRPTLKYILKFIDKMDFYIAVKTLVLCWKENKCDRGQYRDILNEFLSKSEVDVCFTFNSEAIPLILLSCDDVEMNMTLLNIKSVKEGKKFLHCDNGIRMSCYLIEDGRMDYLIMFLKEILSEEEVIEYKMYFFEKTRMDITISSLS